MVKPERADDRQADTDPEMWVRVVSLGADGAENGVCLSLSVGKGVAYLDVLSDNGPHLGFSLVDGG